MLNLEHSAALTVVNLRPGKGGAIRATIVHAITVWYGVVYADAAIT
jgi:uncharacterized protein (DUF697 family)